jgi:hypothetical protein
MAGSADAAARLSVAPNAHTLHERYYPHNLRLLNDLDPHSVSTPIPWGEVQPCEPGTGCNRKFQWDYVDTRMKWIADRGLKVDPMISHAPVWATDGRCNTSGACYPRASHYDDWRRFVSRAVQRYGPDGRFWNRHGFPPRYDIDTWESWHEPNVPGFWERDPDVDAYFRVFKNFSRAVRGSHPEARVMIGSFTFVDEPTRTYVRELFRQHDVRGKFDSVSVHPYAPTARRALNRIRSFHRITRSERIWITEIGWNTATHDQNQYSVTPADQARFFGALIDRARASMPFLRQINVFSLFDLDSGGPSAANASTYGLTLDQSHGFAPKPAYHVIKQRTR